MPSEQDIYEDHVLDHYEDPYHRGPLDSATHADDGKNPLCGDLIHVDLRLSDDGTIEEAWFDGKGCVISQASASMLIEKVEANGWAALGGLVAGDIILQINHESVASLDEIKETLLGFRDSQPRSIVLFIQRGPRTMFIELEPRW